MKNISKDNYDGISTCQICHKWFISDDIEAINNHKKLHKIFLKGVIANKLQSDDEIFDDQNFRLIVISPDSSMAQRNRAQRIAKRAHDGTHYDFLSFHAKQQSKKNVQLVFVGIIDQHAITFLVMREINKSMKMSWVELSQDNPFSKEIPTNHEKRWCLDMIWTLDKFRGNGYAKLTIEQALKYLCKPICEIAWLQPFTEKGILLAKSITQNEIYIPE